MEIRLHSAEALSLAGLTAAASKDRSRVILTALQFRFIPDIGELRVTATDSYRLGQHVLKVEEVPGSGAEAVGDVPDEPFDVLFEAKSIGTALKKARTKDSRVLMTFDPTAEIREGAMSIRVFQNSGNFACEAERIDGTFPKHDILLDPIPWDENWGEVEGKGGAFNPDYFGQMAEILGLKGSKLPMSVLVTDPMKPAAFKRVEQGNIVTRGILMPVRI